MCYNLARNFWHVSLWTFNALYDQLRKILGHHCVNFQHFFLTFGGRHGEERVVLEILKTRFGFPFQYLSTKLSSKGFVLLQTTFSCALRTHSKLIRKGMCHYLRNILLEMSELVLKQKKSKNTKRKSFVCWKLQKKGGG